jgi:hypothetical protein
MNDYGRLDRMFHHLALGNRPFLELSFDLERALFRKASAQVNVERPVFIAGFARAGTSLLVRLLHQTGEFASLTYRDLPVPLAPNLFAKLQGKAKRHLAPRERAHGDGLMHDLESPEAIEEVFWRTLSSQDYIGQQSLETMRASPKVIESFRDYVRLVLLRYEKRRYLSKNNNNILRLGSLAAAFPDMVVVHPFRNPIQHAASLLQQHRLAIIGQSADPFRLRFMQCLGITNLASNTDPSNLTVRVLSESIQTRLTIG